MPKQNSDDYRQKSRVKYNSVRLRVQEAVLVLVCELPSCVFFLAHARATCCLASHELLSNQFIVRVPAKGKT